MNHQSFYQFLMTERNSNSHSSIAEFAEGAFYDQSFPKQSHDYHEISDYLELNAPYLSEMTTFDEAWQKYLAKMN